MNIAITPLRAQGGSERESMRVFPPLADDHPLVGGACPGCNWPFEAGDLVAAVPVGPGDSEDSQRKCARGGWYTCMGVAAHAACAGMPE